MVKLYLGFYWSRIECDEFVDLHIHWAKLESNIKSHYRSERDKDILSLVVE